MKLKPFLAGTALATAMLVVAAPAPAKDGDVVVAGRCTGATTAELELSAEDGRIEVEFEVDQNRNGVRWNLVVRRGGTTVASGVRVTRPPSGSFEFERLLVNRPGPDRITVTARRASGATCTATAVWRR